MTLDESGGRWRGEDFADLAEYVRRFQAEGYPVDQVVESVCDHCNGRAFRVLVDDAEGCAADLRRLRCAGSASVFAA